MRQASAIGQTLILGHMEGSFCLSGGEGGDAREEEQGNNAAAAVWPYKRKFFSKPKGETRGMLDKLVVLALSLKAKLSRERGQDLVEYAVLTGSIAILVIAAAVIFGGAVSTWFGDLTTWFGSIGPGA